MKKLNKKRGWAALAVLLALLVLGAYYSVSRATEDLNCRLSGGVTADSGSL